MAAMKPVTYYAKGMPNLRIGKLKFSREGFLVVTKKADMKAIEESKEFKYGKIVKEESIAGAIEKTREAEAEEFFKEMDDEASQGEVTEE